MKLKTSEADEQKILVNYLQIKKIKHSAIPNSTWTPSWAQKNKNKALGLCAGLPDLVIVVPSRDSVIKSFLLFIEMKKRPNKPTQSQQEWIDELNNCVGVIARIFYSGDEAIKYIEELIN